MWKSDVKTVHHSLTQLVKEGLIVRYPKKGTFVRQREERLTCIGLYYAYNYFGTSGSLYIQSLHEALKTELNIAGIEMDMWLDPRPGQKTGEPWAPLARAAELRKFQALIAPVTSLANLRWVTKLAVPTAFQGGANLPNHVQYNMPQFAELGLQALAKQGCRSVGLIAPMATSTVHADARPPYDGFFGRFTDLSGDLGLTIKSQWMRVPRYEGDLENFYRNSAEAFGYEQFLQLWKQATKPDGLIVFDDVTARGVIMALQAQQVRVPEELKLVLHKNEAIDLLCPVPATFAVSSERAMARALIEQVQKQFRGEPVEPISLPFRLMVHRGSSQRETNQPMKGVSQL